MTAENINIKIEYKIQQNVENDDDEGSSDGEPPQKKTKESTPTKKYIQKYKKEWENKDEFKAWLSESIHGNTYFYCKFCKNDYRCGISDIYKHMASKKHKINMGGHRNYSKFTFKGLLCPAFTPFSNLNSRSIPEICLKAIPAYSNYLKQKGVSGILINDTIGEGMSLTLKERLLLTERWVECCNKNNQFLMVQIGGGPLKEVIEMIRHAERLKVGAVVLLPDLYNKPSNHLDLIRYLKIISEFAKEIPMLYHHNPQLTGVTFDVTNFLIDITGEVDSFVGIIYSTNDMSEASKANNVNTERFVTFVGTDEAILAASAIGFDCIMAKSLNFAPKLVEKICNTKNDKITEAQKSQCTLNKILCGIYEHGDAVPALKATMEIVTSITGIYTRAPLQTLWEGTRKKLEGKLKEFNII